MAKIPVIDAGQDDVPAALVEAWKETGFCTLVNHGVDAELVGKALAASRAFFDLPVSDKKLYGYQGHASNRGYIEQGIEHHPESSAAPDRKETFDIGKEGEEGLENMWPTELDDSTFKDVMLDYWEAMNGLYLRMMKWTAIGLGLDDAEFFVDRCDEEHCNLRLLHYPAGPAAGSRGAVHTDFGTVTLLVQDATGGLKVQLKGDGTWTHVEPLPNAIVCNVGDMLQRWTNDVLTATPHQVTDPPDSAGDSVPERYSIAFFCNANKSVTLEPVLLPGGGGEAKYEPIRAIDYLTKRLTETISPSSDEKKDASS